ncbi:hypothetical protein [Mycolicibacterium elephantis]|uniref:hypothetical protein n=1 Tax=Mycolicibacterium elephantis TaxID=81858 RepID=UPI0007E9A23F|nr:hypothetical protein [Mycolicibacterium elephantis]OBB28257.1 hypothetical protein A5762_06450 [Mycolicibacterium elephantis]OBE98325.1 hypothetical protein A5776_15030 [Mycolicibacterium elephantis]
MGRIILGTEAIERGELTRGQLRSRYRSIFRDVYIPREAEQSLHASTVGAWLWSGRRGVITGRAAAALHGDMWVDDDTPVELLWANNRPPSGIITRRDRIGDDEIVRVDGMPVAGWQRTAFDLGRYLPRGAAVAHLDALARATGITARDVLPLADRYKGARGVRRFREAIELMDAGGASPKETWLRLLLIDAGFPRPQTQIPVYDPEYGWAYIDMGWEDPLIGLEYDGDQHRTDPRRYAMDIAKHRMLQRRKWIMLRVIKEHHSDQIISWVREAWTRREREAMVAISAA